MNLDELRSVQSKERQKDSLQNLRPSFYQEVGEYIAELEDERERVAEQADDPFSAPEVGRLTDEIETAKDVVEAIYERRMGKLVKQASLSAAGMAADDEGLTAEEADLFDDLVDRIRSNKTRVLDVLEGAEADPADTDARREGTEDAPPTPPMEPAADADPAGHDSSETESAGGDPTPSPESGGVTPADVMGGDGPAIDETGAGPGGESEPGAPSPPSDERGGEPLEREGEHERPDAGSDPVTGSESDDPTVAAPDAGSGNDIDRVTVRITRDVGSILGVDDREYTLSSDDVVTLPEQNASPLVERDAAEPLE